MASFTLCILSTTSIAASYPCVNEQTYEDWTVYSSEKEAYVARSLSNLTLSDDLDFMFDDNRFAILTMIFSERGDLRLVDVQDPPLLRNGEMLERESLGLHWEFSVDGRKILSGQLFEALTYAPVDADQRDAIMSAFGAGANIRIVIDDILGTEILSGDIETSGFFDALDFARNIMADHRSREECDTPLWEDLMRLEIQ